MSKACRHPQKTRSFPMFRKLAIDLLLLALLAALGVVAWRLAPLLTPQSDRSLPLSLCNPGQKPSCRVLLAESATMEFSLSPRPIPVLKPLQIEVRLDGIEARRIEVDFAGTEMKMGYNRPRLEKGADGIFRGNASLPVCITGRMNWQATVLVETSKEHLAVPFQFETRKNNSAGTDISMNHPNLKPGASSPQFGASPASVAEPCPADPAINGRACARQVVTSIPAPNHPSL